jgi:hypothetical protein
MELRKESYGAFIFDRVHRRVITLNDIAVRVIEMSSDHTVGEIVQMVKDENSSADPAFIEKFMLDFLQDSLDQGVLEVV